MKYRINDKEAKERFSRKGVVLNTGLTELDGFKIHYAKTGIDTLTTLFFVHGSPDGWIRYERFLQDKDLHTKYRMIAIDRPGFGYSEFGHAKNLKEQSKLIGRFVRSIENGKPIYSIGHSYGGAVVVRLQVDHKDLFDGLVLLSASLDPKEEKPERWRYIMKVPPLNFLLPGAFRPSNKELVYLKHDLRELDKEWHKITCPVWILHGANDKYVPVSNASCAKNKLTQAGAVVFKILPGADHYITNECYGDIKELLLRLPAPQS